MRHILFALIFAGCSLAQAPKPGPVVGGGGGTGGGTGLNHEFNLGLAQGAGCSYGGNVLTATAPGNCYVFTGSSTASQMGRPQFTATTQALYFDFILPSNYTANSALVFEWTWINPSDTNTGHTVTWDINHYGCSAAGSAAQPTLIAGSAATATAIQSSSANTSQVTLSLTPSGSGVGNCQPGNRFYFYTTLNALTATDSPILVGFRIQ